MKKFVLVMLAAVMVFSATVFAGEAATEATTAATEATTAAPEAATEASAEKVYLKDIAWTQELQDMFVSKGYAGTFMTIDALGLELLVPEGMEQRKPTDEEKKQDIILVFENKDATDKIQLVLGPVGECKTLDDVVAFMKENYPDVEVTPTKINQFDTLMYGSKATDSMAVLIGAGDAGFLRVIMSPAVSDQNKNELYTFVAASLQQIQEEEETTAEAAK